MATRPTFGVIPNWASDVTFSSGIETGTATTLEPSAAEKAQGVRAGRWVARKANWLFRTLSTWLTWCVAELDERPDFVDGGTFTHSGDVTLNGGGDLTIAPTSGPALGAFNVNKAAVQVYAAGSGISISESAITVNKATNLSATTTVTDEQELRIADNGELVVQSGGAVAVQSGGIVAVQSGGTLDGAAGSVVNLNGETNVGYLNVVHDVSPVQFSANKDVTATSFWYREYVFTGLTTGRSLEITATPVANLKFYVYNSSPSWEVAVVVNGVTLGTVGGGSGAASMRMFYYDGFVWNVS